mmetsp:Transcript_6200/g.11759  ORF Transcript_6200/g.11759 Transcript_6200/m.11759 type:complete len:278 (+) Transcript_6200:46-879(+)
MSDLDEQAHFFVQKGARSVSVQGEAEISTQPDLVTVTLGVATRNSDLAVARAETQAGVEKVVAVAHSFSFPAEDVQTQRLICEKRVEIVDEDGISVPEPSPFGRPMEQPKSKRRRVEYYSVSLNVNIKVNGPRIDQYDDIMQALLGTGAGIDGEDMETTRLGELRHEARKMAVQNAKSKAEALTAGTGAKVGFPILIRENIPSPPRYGYRGGRTMQTARRSTGGKAPRKQLATRAARAGGDDDDDDEGTTEDISPKIFQLGSIKVTSTVDIVFELNV